VFYYRFRADCITELYDIVKRDGPGTSAAVNVTATEANEQKKFSVTPCLGEWQFLRLSRLNVYYNLLENSP